MVGPCAALKPERQWLQAHRVAMAGRRVAGARLRRARPGV